MLQKVIVSAPPHDAHAIAVTTWLKGKGVEVLRISAGNLQDGHLSFNPLKAIDYLGLHSSNSSKAYEYIVWLRRLATNTAPNNMNPFEQDFCRDESRAISGGILASLEALQNEHRIRFVDPVAAAMRAEYKLLQLSVAAQLGARIPDTLVTNDPTQAINFKNKGPTLAKPLSAAARVAPFVDRLPDDLIPAIETVPTLLQREVEAVADVRILVCGGRAIGWQRARESEVGPDWRRHDPHGNNFHRTDLTPAQVDLSCSIVQQLGLTTSVQDWVVDRSGKFWFLESNPQGAWLFLRDAYELALPIFGEHLIGITDE